MGKEKKESLRKKVGILTYFDGINYGAFFQSYSLFRVLKTIFGTDVEFINYKSLRHRVLESLVFYHRLFDLKYLINNIIKIHMFRKSQRIFKKSKLIIFRSQLAKQRYDYVFYGSDEIWNFKNPLVGYNPVYFGHYIKSNKIAYAPSFGSIDNSEELTENVLHGLCSFQQMSVRDENSQKIIFNNLKTRPPIVLDPTLLIDKTLKESLPNNSNYILIYSTNLSQQYISSIKKFASRQKMQLISIGYYYKWCDKSYVNVGPSDWLGYFKDASYIITSMFHGTIFAIKYKKKFVSIITKYRKNKISSLLKYIKLEDRILSNPNDLENKLLRRLNYRIIFETIGQKREESLSFIRKSLML